SHFEFLTTSRNKRDARTKQKQCRRLRSCCVSRDGDHRSRKPLCARPVESETGWRQCRPGQTEPEQVAGHRIVRVAIETEVTDKHRKFVWREPREIIARRELKREQCASIELLVEYSHSTAVVHRD